MTKANLSVSDASLYTPHDWAAFLQATLHVNCKLLAAVTS